MFLAGLILVIEMVRHSRLEELLLLSALLTPIGAMGSHLARSYFKGQSSGIGRTLGGSNEA